MKLKGISPLVATVLLVSITIVVAAIVASWANFFVKGKTDDIQRQSDKEKECQFANFRVVDDLISWSDSKVKIGLDNIGQTNLTGFTFIVKYSNGNATLVNADGNYSVASGDFAMIATEPLNSKPTEVVIRTSCLDVTSTVEVA